MDKLTDPAHPLWSLLRLVIMMVALTFILWINASSFDATEIKTLVSVFLVAVGVEGASQFIKGKSH